MERRFAERVGRLSMSLAWVFWTARLMGEDPQLSVVSQLA